MKHFRLFIIELLLRTNSKIQTFLTSTLGHPKNFPKNFHQIMGQ